MALIINDFIAKYGIASLCVKLGENILQSSYSDYLFYRLGTKKVIDLELEATRQCITKSGLSSSDIDLIISSSTATEFLAPGNASIIQKEIEATNAMALSIEAHCASFIVSISLAESLGIRYGFNNVLIVLSSTYSKIIGVQADKYNYSDAAGAILLSAGTKSKIIVDTKICSYGSLYDKKVVTKNSGSSEHMMKNISAYDSIDLKLVSAKQIPNIGFALLRANELSVENISAIFFHQSPSLSTWIDNSLKTVKIIPDLFSEYGNLGMVNIPFLIDYYSVCSTIKPTDIVLCLSPGIGWHAAGMVLRW